MTTQNTESPVIVLPADEAWQEELKAKLEEYRRRLALKRADPYLAPELRTRTFCKVKIVECLLRDGKVVMRDLSRELAKELGELWDGAAFDEACWVITEYCSVEGRAWLQKHL